MVRLYNDIPLFTMENTQHSKAHEVCSRELIFLIDPFVGALASNLKLATGFILLNKRSSIHKIYQQIPVSFPFSNLCILIRAVEDLGPIPVKLDMRIDLTLRTHTV